MIPSQYRNAVTGQSREKPDVPRSQDGLWSRVRAQAFEDHDIETEIAESAGRNWADYTYAILPNIQVFWMVDALSDDRTIPWRYMASAFGYAGLYILALLALAAALFETREVG